MRASCSICSDLFDGVNSFSAVPCGHVYHSDCLISWINQSSTCPECRTEATHEKVFKLHFSTPPADFANSSALENEISDLQAQLCAKNIELEASKKETAYEVTRIERQAHMNRISLKEVIDFAKKRLKEKKAELFTCKREIEGTVGLLNIAEKEVSDLQQTICENESRIADLCLKVKSLNNLQAQVSRLKQTNTALTEDCACLMTEFVYDTEKGADDILKDCSSSPMALKIISANYSDWKQEPLKITESENKLRDDNVNLPEDISQDVAKRKYHEDAICLFIDTPFDGKKPKRKCVSHVNSSPLPSTPVSIEPKPCSSSDLDSSLFDVTLDIRSNIHVKSHNDSSKTCQTSTKENGKDIIALPVPKADSNSRARSKYNFRSRS